MLIACEETPQPGKQVLVSNKFQRKIIDSYWLYLPPNYSEQKKWPIILFLQGQDGISADPATCKNEGPVAARNSTVGKLVNKFIIINPHMTVGPIEERDWSQYSGALLQIVNDVSRTYSVDSNRLYLTGLSLGGTSTWSIAKQHPNVFAAIVPISGRLSCNKDCDKLAAQRMWIIHNESDPRVSSRYSLNVVRYLEENLSVKFIQMPSVDSARKEDLLDDHLFALSQNSDHDAWTTAYNSPQLYEWLLSKTKSD